MLSWKLPSKRLTNNTAALSQLGWARRLAVAAGGNSLVHRFSLISLFSTLYGRALARPRLYNKFVPARPVQSDEQEPVPTVQADWRLTSKLIPNDLPIGRLCHLAQAFP
jgi:hypothetical protein